LIKIGGDFGVGAWVKIQLRLPSELAPRIAPMRIAVRTRRNRKIFL